MSCCDGPLQDTRRYKRDSVLALMVAKGWLYEMRSSVMLDQCIEKAEKCVRNEDKGKGSKPEIDTLEDYVYLIDKIFSERFKKTIREHFETLYTEE